MVSKFVPRLHAVQRDYSNGHKTQMNVPGLAFSYGFSADPGDYPWVNAFKNSSWWSTSGSGVTEITDFTILDANGYLTSLGSYGTLYAYFYIPSAAQKTGQWKIITTGVMTYEIHSDDGDLSAVTTGSGVTTATVTMPNATANYMRIKITSIGSPYCSSIAFVHEDDYPGWLTGEVYTSQFRSLISKLRSVRFMPWMVGATPDQCADDQRPVNYVRYNLPWYNAADVTANVFTQSVSDPCAYTLVAPGYSINSNTRFVSSFNANSMGSATVTSYTKGNPTTFTINHAITGLAVGQKMAFTIMKPVPYYNANDYNLSSRFSMLAFTITGIRDAGLTFDIDLDTSSATDPDGGILEWPICYPVMTIDINGTGPKPIITDMGWYANSSQDHDSTVGGWLSGEARALRWNPGLDGYVISSNRRYGCPHFSLMIRLANDTGTDPWFCIPHLACDVLGNNPSYTGLPDYQSTLMQACKTTLHPGLKPLFEVSNELWNGSGRMYAWRANSPRYPAYDQIKVFGNYEWCGYVCVFMGQQAANIWGVNFADVKTQQKYVVLIPTAEANGYSNLPQNTDSANGPNSFPLTYHSGDADKVAYKWCQGYTYANYWNSGYYHSWFDGVETPYSPAEIAFANRVAALSPGAAKDALLQEYLATSNQKYQVHFTGSVTGTTLTVTAVANGFVGYPFYLYDAATEKSLAMVFKQLTNTNGSGIAGKEGTYSLDRPGYLDDPSGNYTSQAMLLGSYFETIYNYNLPAGYNPARPTVGGTYYNFYSAGEHWDLDLYCYEGGYNAVIFNVVSQNFPINLYNLRLDCRNYSALEDMQTLQYTNYWAWGPRNKLPSHFLLSGQYNDGWACWYPSTLTPTINPPYTWRSVLAVGQ